MAVKCVIWGHSFVRRFQAFLEERNLSNVGLELDKFSVSCIGLGGLKLEQRRRLHSKDNDLSGSDLVLIDIGSNDLTKPSYSPEQFALDIMSYASFLIIGLNVKKVVILQVLHRDCVPYTDYNSVVIQANVAIQKLTDTTSLPIVFWKHRGMWNCQDFIFCSDGIHLSNDIGYPKYMRSVRDCIIRVNRWSLNK